MGLMALFLMLNYIAKQEPRWKSLKLQKVFKMNYEPWIWTEFLAFDNTSKDFGVSAYLEKTGFIPEVICLLSSTPDIVLQHQPLTEEIVLSPAICSRDGHAGNEERRRQDWTNFQLRSLVKSLQQAGVKVYLSLFTVFYQNEHHHEWMSDHPEALQEWDYQGKGLNINVTRRFNDGTYIEDYFIGKMVQTIVDYGFDGWHGPDGFGPLTSGALVCTDCGDDIMDQFAATIQTELPECVTCVSNENTDLLIERMAWIWGNVRKEWIKFNINRWAAFWTKMTAALHNVNKKAAINSAWTKACFEAEYRYGIDYKKIMNTQVDYMIVETVAAGVALSGGDDFDLHYEYLAMFMEIKAYAPELKLISLHGIKDITENWDLLRHAPTMLQREFYSLANVYYGGKRVSSGFLACLGDGIKADEWTSLRELWDASFAGDSIKQGVVTVIWSDDAHSKLLDDYIAHGTWNNCKQMQTLMENGVQVQNIDRIENLDKVTGTIFVANAHLLNPAELRKIKDYQNGEVYMTERTAEAYIGKMLHKELVSSDYSFTDDGAPKGFRDFLNYCTIDDEFWVKMAESINQLDTLVRTDNNNLRLMTQIIDENNFILAVKNDIFSYQCPEIVFERNIASLEVTSEFPHTEQEVSGNKLTLRKVPPKGVVTMKVCLSNLCDD
jgi:hypothetical protein